MQNEIYLRIAPVAVGNALRDQMGGNGLTGRHPDGAHQLLPDATGLTQRAIEFIQQALKPGRQLLSCLREHHFTRRSVKQAYAGLVLQLFYAMADRRLAKTNTLPCPAKAFNAGNGHKNF